MAHPLADAAAQLGDAVKIVARGTLEGSIDGLRVRFRRDDDDPRAVAEASLPAGCAFALDAGLRRGVLTARGAPAEVVRRAIGDDVRARLGPLLDGTLLTDGRTLRLTFRRWELTAADVVHALRLIVDLVHRVDEAHAAIDDEHPHQTDGPFRGAPDPRPSRAARDAEVAAFVAARRR